MMHRTIKALIATGLLCTSWAAQAQDSAKVKLRPYGFIRTYLNFDSRQTHTVVGGEYNTLPYDQAWNEDHSEDLNATPHLQMQALTSRIGLDLSGPTVWGMATGGKVESDFGGFGTTNTVFRIRHAYIRLSRSKEVSGIDTTGPEPRPYTRTDRSEWIIGQAWHPLSGDIMPDVLGMAAGAPFRPHSRTPQLRYTGYTGPLGVTAALLSQLQFVNYGPRSATDPASTPSADYAHQALWPEAFLGLNYRGSKLYVQLGIDAQLLRPRVQARIDGVTQKVHETVGSLTPTVYLQYDEGLFSLKFRTLLASNTSHLNQMVGYGITGINADGTWSYTPLRAGIGYLNLSAGRQLKGNLFLGYMKNLGSADALTPFGDGYRIYTYGGSMFTHLNSAWRIAPSVVWRPNAFSLGVEYELTGATYGDLGPRGNILFNSHLRAVSNHRICLMAMYQF